MQKPTHVKLCVSSRPEVRIAEKHPSFMETKLADLNCKDIQIFVHGKLEALAEPDRRDSIVREICDRADGVFMWAVFAVKQVRDVVEHRDHSEILNRLDDMGPGLESAFAHILGSIRKHDRATLAFYLQAMKSLSDAGMGFSMSVALMAASSDEREIQSIRELAVACRIVEDNIRSYSRGLIETKHHSYQPQANRVLVKDRLNPSSNVGTQAERQRHSSTANSWRFADHDSYLLEVTQYCQTSLSLIHRSAYDFFFSPDDEHAGKVEEMMEAIRNGLDIPAQVQRGFSILFWLQPIQPQSWDYPCHSEEEWFRAGLGDRLPYIIRYTVRANISKYDQTILHEDLLLSIRFEILSFKAPQPLHEQCRRIPGDLFSGKLLDGAVQLLDQDRFTQLEEDEPYGVQEFLVQAESMFWNESIIAAAPRLDTYLRDRMTALGKSHLGRHTLVTIWWQSAATLCWNLERRAMLFDCIKLWSDELAREEKSVNLVEWIWRLLTGHAYTRPRQRPVALLGNSKDVDALFQWTSTCTDKRSNLYVARFLRSCVKNVLARYSDIHDLPGVGEFVRRMLGQWDVWTQLHFADRKNSTLLSPTVAPSFPTSESHGSSSSSAEASEKCTTCVFIPVSDIYDSLPKVNNQLVPHLVQSSRIRLLHLSGDGDDYKKVLCSHEVDLAKTSGPKEITARRFDGKETFLTLPPLEQSQIDVLIQEVGRSMSLDQNQKDVLVKDIGMWEFRDQQSDEGVHDSG